MTALTDQALAWLGRTGIVSEPRLTIEGGRHPVERFSDAPFVPSDLQDSTMRAAC
jgi:hypothetical protein